MDIEDSYSGLQLVWGWVGVDWSTVDSFFVYKHDDISCGLEELLAKVSCIVGSFGLAV